MGFVFSTETMFWKTDFNFFLIGNLDHLWRLTMFSVLISFKQVWCSLIVKNQKKTKTKKKTYEIQDGGLITVLSEIMS